MDDIQAFRPTHVFCHCAVMETAWPFLFNQVAALESVVVLIVPVEERRVAPALECDISSWPFVKVAGPISAGLTQSKSSFPFYIYTRK
jgi:hypothetical protein